MALCCVSDQLRTSLNRLNLLFFPKFAIISDKELRETLHLRKSELCRNIRSAEELPFPG